MAYFFSEKLSKGSSREALMAYQIAFDMYESATQQFLSRVLAAIKKTAPETPAAAADTPAATEEMESAEETKKEEKTTEEIVRSSSCQQPRAALPDRTASFTHWRSSTVWTTWKILSPQMGSHKRRRTWTRWMAIWGMKWQIL